MTRQNVTDGVREIMTKPCPVCSGEGVVKSEETIAIEFARHLRHMVIEAGDGGPEAYLLRINPKVTAWFIADGARELHAIEQETGAYFHFEGSDGLPLDYFAVTMEGTRAEIEEHAVPFRAGEEVHVHLVEPHMYNDDDAVAKVDGYLIDVVNGIAFVGEKKLVRIEEAGRTIARAVLTGPDAEAAEVAAAERAGAREKALQASRRSAAAKKGAARRREREDAVAVAALTDETPVEAGTAPAGLADADEPPTPRKRSRRRRRSGDPDVASAVEARDAVAEEPAAEEDAAPRPRRGRARTSVAAADPAVSGAEATSEDEAPARGRSRRRAVDADDGAEAPEAATEDPAPPGAPKPPARKGRARKRPAEPAAEEAVAAEAGAADDEEGPKPAAKRRSRRRTADEEPEAEAPEVDIDDEGEEGDDDEEDGDDDALSSRPRRRGRRGGRRRSRAKAQADAEVSD
jgi:ribonuclease G